MANCKTNLLIVPHELSQKFCNFITAIPLRPIKAFISFYLNSLGLAIQIAFVQVNKASRSVRFYDDDNYCFQEAGAELRGHAGFDHRHLLRVPPPEGHQEHLRDRRHESGR